MKISLTISSANTETTKEIDLSMEDFLKSRSNTFCTKTNMVETHLL